jgi:hypothetical protein
MNKLNPDYIVCDNGHYYYPLCLFKKLYDMMGGIVQDEDGKWYEIVSHDQQKVFLKAM